MEESKREAMIRSYVLAYNTFDIDGMMKDVDDSIRFENISDGIVTMTLSGSDAFRQQALRAKEMFADREQIILSFRHDEEITKADIEFHGVLAENLPNGLQKGDEIRVQGTSLFRFANDKIISIIDVG